MLSALDRRLESTGSRLRAAGPASYAIEPNLGVLTTQQWTQLGHAWTGHTPVTPLAATQLHHLLFFQSHRPRTDRWDEGDEGLRYLREQHLLDGRGRTFSPMADVRYSLGLED